MKLIGAAKTPIAVAAMLTVAASLSACNIVGPAAYLVHGPPKVDAKHKLDKSRTTVIFIDDRANRMPRRSLRLTAAESAEQALMRQGAVPEKNMITTRSAMRAAQAERYGQPLSIAQIGQTAGAEVIIYAAVQAWSLSRDGVTFSPAARASVKVVDAANDRRLFPPSGDGYPLTVELPQSSEQMPSGAQRQAAHDALASALGVRLARLFYQHQRDPLSGSLGD